MKQKDVYLVRNEITDFVKIAGAEKAIELFETEVLNVKNATLSYYFARDVEGADIKAHAQVVKSDVWSFYYDAFMDDIGFPPDIDIDKKTTKILKRLKK